MDSRLTDIYVRANLNCASPVDMAYYSAGYEMLCFHWGTEEDLVEKAGYYPHCSICTAKPVLSSKAWQKCCSVVSRC